MVPAATFDDDQKHTAPQFNLLRTHGSRSIPRATIGAYHDLGGGHGANETAAGYESGFAQLRTVKRDE
jgi:hypothetical protein